MKFCHKCGTPLEEEDRFCPNCGQMIRGLEGTVPDTPYPTSKSSGSPVGSSESLDYKGVGIRFVAQLVDLIIVLVFFFIAGNITAGLVGGKTAEGFEMHGTPALVVIFLTSLFGLAYFVFLESFLNGQTLGKKLTGIQVVREDGGPIDFSTAFVRNILRVVDGLIFYLVGAILIWRSPLKQRLGDRIAHTVVIKTSRSETGNTRKKAKITFGSSFDTD
ncbi:MAG: RDD family protein [Pseudomonadota bacterium]